MLLLLFAAKVSVGPLRGQQHQRMDFEDCDFGYAGKPRRRRCSGQEHGSIPIRLSVRGVRPIGCRPSMIASMMAGSRKARGRVRLMSPASRLFCRARSRTDAARPSARSEIQCWASARTVMSFASGFVRRLTAGLHDQLRLDPTPLQLNGNREAERVLEAPHCVGIWV